MEKMQPYPYPAPGAPVVMPGYVGAPPPMMGNDQPQFMGAPPPMMGTDQLQFMGAPPPMMVTAQPEFVGAPPPMVVTSQPVVIVSQPPAYKDYLALSIMNLLCCCLPFGIVALVYSIQTRDAKHRYDSMSASKHSRSAFIWNMVALSIGLCINIIWIACVIYYSVAGSTYTTYYYG